MKDIREELLRLGFSDEDFERLVSAISDFISRVVDVFRNLANKIIDIFSKLNYLGGGDIEFNNKNKVNKYNYIPLNKQRSKVILSKRSNHYFNRGLR